MPKINSLEVVHQDTNQDSYQNLHDILVDLNKSLALNKEVVDAEARASIENLLELYANDKEAFLKSIQTLTAQLKNSEAIYSEEISLLASQLEVQARRTTTLTAQTENNIASVKEYSEAVASEVTRKISTYSQATAPTDNLVYGDLWMDTDDNNKMYRWNGSVWVATDDSRIATSYARWGVQVDVNGNVAGIQLNSDNIGTSEFTVVANNFKVYGTGALDKPIFTTSSVGGSSTIVLNGNTMIGDNAITVPVNATSSSVISGNGTYQNILSATVSNTATVTMSVVGVFTARQGYAAQKTTGFRVNNGSGTLIDYSTIDAINDFPNFQFYDTISAGSSKTFTIQWYGQDSNVVVGIRSLTVLGVKK